MLRVPTPVYQPLPAALTAAIPLPQRPPEDCVGADGQPTVCVLDALKQLPQCLSRLRQCNADRARAATLGRTAEELGNGR